MTVDADADADADVERIAELSVAATAAAATGRPLDPTGDATSDPSARRVVAVIEAIAAARPVPDAR